MSPGSPIIATAKPPSTRSFAILQKISQGPGPDGQDAPARVEQHQFFARNGGEIAEQPLAIVPSSPSCRRIAGASFGTSSKEPILFLGTVVRFDGVHEGQELVADVAIGVVQDGPVDEIAPVEPFHRVPVEPDPDGCPAEKGKDAAHAGEELAVDDDVEAQFPHLSGLRQGCR